MSGARGGASTVDAPAVCIVNAYLPPDYGGAELAGYEYARRLRANGAEVTLIGRRFPSRPRPESLPDWVVPVAVPGDGEAGGLAGRLPGAVGNLLRTGIPLWREMWRLRRRFDVVQVFNSAPLFNLLAAPFGRLLGKEVILEMSLVGSDDPMTLRNKGRASRESPPGRPSLKYLLFLCADAYVSKSPALSRAYREAGLPEDRLWEVPYGVDTRTYSPPTREERRATRRELGLPTEGVVALFVGGMNPRKGVHWLVDAFRSIRHRHEDLHLLLVGPSDKYDPQYVEGLRDAARAGGAAGRILLEEGLVENVGEYMRAANVFVLPSKREGLPITVLEAMATGLTVIASDIPEISDTQVRSGRNGLLVPVGDVDALASALSTAAGDDDLRQRLGRSARRRVEARFSTEVVDRIYRRLYGTLMDGQPRSKRQPSHAVADDRLRG